MDVTQWLFDARQISLTLKIYITYKKSVNACEIVRPAEFSLFLNVFILPHTPCHIRTTDSRTKIRAWLCYELVCQKVHNN